MQTTAKNTAFAPLSTATQMAADAADHMTEADQLVFAIGLVNRATQSGSVRTLRRISLVALATAQDIQTSRMATTLSPESRIDPVFWRLFLSFYNRDNQPAISTAYRHTCLLVSQDKTDCIVASEHQIRHALTDMHCVIRAGAQNQRTN